MPRRRRSSARKLAYSLVHHRLFRQLARHALLRRCGAGTFRAAWDAVLSSGTIAGRCNTEWHDDQKCHAVRPFSTDEMDVLLLGGRIVPCAIPPALLRALEAQE